jgi:hypothetical protein
MKKQTFEYKPVRLNKGCIGRSVLYIEEFDNRTPKEGILVNYTMNAKIVEVFDTKTKKMRYLIPSQIVRVGLEVKTEFQYNYRLRNIGDDHLERCGLTRSSTFEEVCQKLRWGTYGKSGKCKLRYVRLCDCSTEHLNNILIHAKGVVKGTIVEDVIDHILAEREKENATGKLCKSKKAAYQNHS